MKFSKSFRENFIYTIALLYIFLFTYAAISKILDFQNFQAQLGQSPLLSAYADFASYGVLAAELMLSCLLAVPRSRIVALYASFLLMVVFTAYIVVILNFSSYIPCSCGGILEKLGWTEHLIFNLAFVLLGAAALLAKRMSGENAAALALLTLAGSAFITLLFLSSEDVIQKENPFIRRFAPHSAERISKLELGNYKFYFAGMHEGKIYLANTTSPLTIIETDAALNIKIQHRIILSNDQYPFRNVKVKIAGNSFFLYDGYVPVIFRGSLTDWKASVWAYGKPYFSELQPVDQDCCIFRAQQLGTNQNVLGSISKGGQLAITKNQALLQKQVDGIFDTDGTLVFSEGLGSFIYTYFYRNQFIVANKNLELQYRGKTIDTTSKAKVKVVTLKESGDTKMAAPPYTVNLRSVAYSNLLFNQSGLRGRYESSENWKIASVVDVYNLLQNTYVGSFYIYNENKEKMTAMMASRDAFYAIIGHQLVKYRFGKTITSKIITDKTK